MAVYPSDIIIPQLGVGGFTPKPIKLKNASKVINRGIRKVTATTQGPIKLGSIKEQSAKGLINFA